MGPADPARLRLRPRRSFATLAAGWLALGCAGALVVRAPQEPLTRPEGALASVPPLAVAVPEARGAAAAADPLGQRAGGWGRRGGDIALTERPGEVLRRLLVEQLQQAGHRVVEADPDVTVGIEVREFSVDAPRAGRGWDVTAGIRIALRVERRPGDAGWSEFVYSAESTAHTPAPPGVGLVERVLGEALERLAALVAEREALAAALRRIGSDPG